MNYKNKPGKHFLPALLICTLLISGCTTEEKLTITLSSIDTINQPSATNAPLDEFISEEQSVINPLTGLPVSDPALLLRHPVMVKVSNYPRFGRPHFGLSFADIVFDYYIGSGTNRFLAVFYGQDSQKIGPLRSGRRIDTQLVNLYEGILAYGSADENTDAILVQGLGPRAISYLEAPYPAFEGSDTHSVVGVFANSSAISQFARENGIDEGVASTLAGMVFDTLTPQSGKPAENILILFNYYNRGEWRYDPNSRQYLRWIEEMGDDAEEFEMIPLLDRVNNQQLAFDNILVLFVEYIEYAPSVHDAKLVENTTGQQAAFFRDGQYFQGIWKITRPDDPIQFFDMNGDPYPLKPGKTWIVLTDKASLFTEKSPAHWEVFFNLP